MYPPKDDLVFQSLFRKGNERITKALIESITNEKIKKINLETEKNLLKDYRKEKGGRLDFKAILDNGEICHIDVQLEEKGNEEKRFLDYWSRIYSTQIDKGENYEKLNKVISIIIVGYKLKKTEKIKDIMTKWKIKEDKGGKLVLTDDFEMYIIELQKAKEILEKEPNNKLAQWMCFFDNPEKEEVKEIMKTNKEIEEAMKKLEEINSDEELKRIIEIRRRNELERNTDMKHAEEKGRSEGIAEGITKGRAEGMAEGITKGRAEGMAKGIVQGIEKNKIETAKAMKEERLDIKLISKITGLSEEEIVNL